ncbi:hypothetical protein SETIT_5G127000v2 [Setaria italica]|uniref:Serine hydrolase domain-containing protein n=2 Tax=Setaria TaxID=4554 RepID=K3XR48_SETIT|nr:hypothetical protein SETIT_5G127000v2 [Setaria italica]TKW13791.1 hypothetical protein SEVIR_5G124200v2 [Setaria viridis]
MSVACHGCYGRSLILQTHLCIFRQVLTFTGVAKVKCVIVISGGEIQATARAFNSKIMCPSLHFIGDHDFAKVHNEELVEAFVDPLVIRHPCGHTIPNLGESISAWRVFHEEKTEVLSTHLTISAVKSKYVGE